jgi:hypothetical protein|tara:strand:- start:2778 stop:3062 length:285 start_codon:yes stop_codon:yes gene_type:complete
MTGRAQHSKGKHAPQSKKMKGRRNHLSLVFQQQSARSIGKTAALFKNIIIPSTDMATLPSAAVKCPNLLTELRRTSILAGIILAILSALVLVID